MSDDLPRIRLRIIGVVSFSLLVALVARLWFLQVMNDESYEQQAIANTERVVRVPAERGRIFDTNGELLVDNKVVTAVSIDKSEFARALPEGSEERQAVLTRLAVEISKTGDLMKVEEIERKLRNSQYSRLGVVPIALDVNDDLMVLIGEHPDEFPGIDVGQTTVRDYPFNRLAAHVLGYVGPINDTEYTAKMASPKGYVRTDEIGKTGIEELFEDVLRGTPGTRVYEVDRQERVIREVSEKNTAPIPGQDIYLTIDIGLQSVAERELETALVEARKQTARDGQAEITAPAGAAVVLDPNDGSVLAMASFPNYAPSDFISGISQQAFDELDDPANHYPLINRAIQGEYAPGSTFKLFTAYAAIKNGFMGTGSLPGVYQPIDDDGVFELRPCTGEKCDYTNARDGRGNPLQYNNVDLPTSLTVSSDTYYYAIGAEMARSTLERDHAIQDAAMLFGLGSQTGVQLPRERSGRIDSREEKSALHDADPVAFPEGRWFTGDNINAAVGQGLTVVTPLQLANGYAAFANGGTLYAPNLVREVREQTPGNELVTSFGPRPIGTIDIPADVRDPILAGLHGVTMQGGGEERSGTAYTAFHDAASGVDFDLNAWPVAGKTGTAEVRGKADSAIFAAFGGPAGAPAQYAMAVVLEESGFGGRNAAPVAAKVYDAIVEGRAFLVPLTVSEVLRCIDLRQQAAATGEANDSTATLDGVPPPITLPSGKSCP